MISDYKKHYRLAPERRIRQDIAVKLPDVFHAAWEADPVRFPQKFDDKAAAGLFQAVRQFGMDNNLWEELAPRGGRNSSVGPWHPTQSPGGAFAKEHYQTLRYGTLKNAKWFTLMLPMSHKLMSLKSDQTKHAPPQSPFS